MEGNSENSSQGNPVPNQNFISTFKGRFQLDFAESRKDITSELNAQDSHSSKIETRWTLIILR